MKHLLLHHVIALAVIFQLQIWSVTSLSTTTRTTTTTTAAGGGGSTTRRVFVGGLTPITAQANDLEKIFQELFGPVEEVSIMNFKTAAPYAFITFDSADAANKALSFEFEYADYQVKPARAMTPRPKSQQRRHKSEQDWDNKLRIAKHSNVMVQVHKSHLERLEEFFSGMMDQGDDNTNSVEVVGTVLHSGSKTVGLLGLRVSDTALFLQILRDLPFTAVALNKVYLVENDYVVVTTEDGSEPTQQQQQLLNSVMTQQKLPRGSILRMDTFPPKLTSSILKSFEEQDDLQLAPTGHTHVLNVVQLQSLDTGKEQKIWMHGISERHMAWSRMQHRVGPDGSTSNSSIDDSDDDICRAYYKLQEAFCRYSAGESVFRHHKSRGGGLVALDCGASPGGWTKYLCEQGNRGDVKRVYSIDPGVLDATVESLPQVQHLRLKVEDALPSIIQQSSDAVHIDVWVSDMCLHQMSAQVDWLLTARDMGLVGAGTFFVLTLKCKVGHSRASFDGQVSQECQRLDGITRDVQVFHLFSNRSGERTVMGYLI